VLGSKQQGQESLVISILGKKLFIAVAMLVSLIIIVPYLLVFNARLLTSKESCSRFLGFEGTESRRGE